MGDNANVFIARRSLVEKIKDLLGQWKRLLGVFMVVGLTAGLGLTLYLSQQKQTVQQHASANYVPPDGMGIFESCAPWASWCYTNLDIFAQGGFKLVVNYGAFNGATTLANLTDYSNRAQQDGMKIIWSFKDMWTDQFTTMATYPELARESGCTTKSCLAAWLVSRVKDFPATWGYYIADEPTSGQYTAVSNLSGIMRKIDTVKPFIIVKNDVLTNGYAPNAAALAQFAPITNVLGEDWYPIGYGQNIANTGAIVNEVQYIANTYHRESTMVLEVKSDSISGRLPTTTDMEEMLTLTLQHSTPRLVLWYWYSGISGTQWNNLVAAIRYVLPPPAPPPAPTATPVPPPPPTATPVPQAVIPIAQCGGLTLTKPIVLSATRVTAGSKITGSVTYTNNCSTAYSVSDIVIAGRPPDGTNGDFTDSIAAMTLQPGQSVTVNGSKIVSILGQWYTYASFQDTSGNWHEDNTKVYFSVVAAPTPTVTPLPTGGLNTSGQTGTTVSKNAATPTPFGGTSAGTRIVGDIDGDRAVTLLDYNYLISCYGSRFHTTTCLAGKSADLNGDGVIDGVDYNIFLRAMSGK